MSDKKISETVRVTSNVNFDRSQILAPLRRPSYIVRFSLNRLSVSRDISSLDFYSVYYFICEAQLEQDISRYNFVFQRELTRSVILHRFDATAIKSRRNRLVIERRDKRPGCPLNRQTATSLRYDLTSRALRLASLDAGQSLHFSAVREPSDASKEKVQAPSPYPSIKKKKEENTIGR